MMTQQNVILKMEKVLLAKQIEKRAGQANKAKKSNN